MIVRAPGGVAHRRTSNALQPLAAGRVANDPSTRQARRPKSATTRLPTAPSQAPARPVDRLDAVRELRRIDGLSLWSRYQIRGNYLRCARYLEQEAEQRRVPFDRVDDRRPLRLRWRYSDTHCPIFFAPYEQVREFDLRDGRLRIETQLGPLKLKTQATCSYEPRGRILRTQFGTPWFITNIPVLGWFADLSADLLFSRNYRISFNNDGLVFLRDDYRHLTIMQKAAPTALRQP